jgi:hypothetical protein
VWKKEQEAAAEERRLDEFRKQIAEEREAQELLRQAQAAGHATRTERLEFMYKGQAEGAAVVGPPPPAPADTSLPLPAALAPPAAAAPASALAVYHDDTPKARNEAWARLHGDPMLVVRGPFS